VTARRRDAADSRERLLRAATGLFAERGYDATTVRDIARAAGVDAALIPRYFGSKTGLYVAAITGASADAPADLLQPERLADLLDRWQTQGTGPVLPSVVGRLDDPVAAAAAQQAVEERLVRPLRSRLQHDDAPDADLRAEVAVAAVAGIALARGAGALATLAEASTDELVALVTALLRQLADSAPAKNPSSSSIARR